MSEHTKDALMTAFKIPRAIPKVESEREQVVANMEQAILDIFGVAD